MTLPKQILIGEFELDVASGCLTKSPDDIHLSPKAVDVLIYLAQRPRELVTRDELLQSVWADRVVTDTQISKAIAELRSAFGDNSEPRKFIETLPRRGYRLVADVKLAGPAKAATELKPTSDTTFDIVESDGGINVAKPATAGAATSSSILGISNRLFIAVFISFLLVSYYVFNGFPISTVDRNTQTDSTSLSIGIVILPFSNISADASNDYFSEGVAEEIRSTLARLAGLRVISRTSSTQFKTSQLDSAEIGRQLDVSHILEGSVRKQDMQVRIAIRLVESKTGLQVWSKQYDRELRDIFDLQSAIATSIANAIEPQLLSNNPNSLDNYGTVNVPAYEAYLRGRYLLASRQGKDMAEAVKAFEEAIEHDPDYLLAYSGLVDTYSLMSLFGVINRMAYIKATDGPLKILESSQVRHAEILTSIGQGKKMRGDIASAIELMEEAIGINKQYLQAYLWLADCYFSFEPTRADKAISLMQTAIRLDPLSTLSLGVLALSQETNGDFDRMKQTLESILSIDAQSTHALRGLVRYHRWVDGNIVEAIRVTHQMWLVEPVVTYAIDLAMNYMNLNEIELARQWFDEASKSMPFLRPIFEFNLLLKTSSDSVLIEFSEQLPNGKPEFYPAYAKALQGNYQEAFDIAQTIPIRRMRGVFASPRDSETALFNAYLLIKLGQQSEAGELIDELRIYFDNKPLRGRNTIGLKMAKLHAITGDNDAAMALLREGMSRGIVSNLWDYSATVYFKELRQLPEFSSLMTVHNAKIEEQRQLLERRQFRFRPN